MNRSFWTAATSSNITINHPVSNFIHYNTAETIFERLEEHGKTWKVYVMEPCPFVVHRPDPHVTAEGQVRPPTSPRSAQFEKDAKDGTLPNFSFIEPNLFAGHGDYHPAASRSDGPRRRRSFRLDPPSSILAGELFLKRLFDAYRSHEERHGCQYLQHDSVHRLGRTGWHLRPCCSRACAAAGSQCWPGSVRLRIRPLRYRVPAIIVSPWVESGSVYNEEHRHTSMIATMRKLWDLGDPLTDRDAIAKPFDYVFTRETPREPEEWAVINARPAPEYHVNWEYTNHSLSTLGKAMTPGVIIGLKEHGVKLPPAMDSPDFALTPQIVWTLVDLLSWRLFPTLAPSEKTIEGSQAAG